MTRINRNRHVFLIWGARESLMALLGTVLLDLKWTASASEQRQGRSLPCFHACWAMTGTGFSCLATFF